MPRRVRDGCFALLFALAVVVCAKRDDEVDRVHIPLPLTDAKRGDEVDRVRVPPNLTDANILAAMDQANMADSLMGDMAASKGMNADVRSFGRDELREHHALRQGGVELASRLHLVPKAAAGSTSAASDRAVADSLRALPAGTAWDMLYLGTAMVHHENELAMLLTAHDETQSLKLAALIARDSSAVDAHRDRARSLLQRLAGLVMASTR